MGELSSETKLKTYTHYVLPVVSPVAIGHWIAVLERNSIKCCIFMISVDQRELGRIRPIGAEKPSTGNKENSWIGVVIVLVRKTL